MAAGSNTIVIKVGPNGKEYNLHTGLLIHHLGYFRGALSGAFRETDDGVVPLLDVDTDAFDVFVDWAYQGTLREDLEYIRHSRLPATITMVINICHLIRKSYWHC